MNEVNKEVKRYVIEGTLVQAIYTFLGKNHAYFDVKPLMTGIETLPTLIDGGTISLDDPPTEDPPAEESAEPEADPVEEAKEAIKKIKGLPAVV